MVSCSAISSAAAHLLAAFSSTFGSREDQYQWQGGAWRNGKLGFASKLALGVSYVPRKVRASGAMLTRTCAQ